MSAATLARRRWIALLLAVLYSVALTWSYRVAETDLFAYQGLVWNPPAWDYLALGFALIGLPCLFMPMEMERPSDLALWLIYATVYIPVCFFPYHVTDQSPMQVTIFIGAMVAAFFALLVVLRLPNFRVLPVAISNRAFFWLLLVLIGLTTFTVASANGFQVNFSLEEAYSRRMDAREAAGRGSFAGYSLAWLAGSLAPIGITYGLMRRNVVMIVAGVVGLMTIFSFSGTKSSLFTPLIMLALFWLVRNKRSRVLNLLLGGTAVLVVFSAFTWTRYENPILSESLTRRLIISKGVSSTFYWQAFQDDPVMMRDSMFARLIGLPEVTEKTYQVGILYGQGENENYNANAWASAFANFGYAGMLLASMVIGLALKLVDSMAEYGNFEVLCVVAAFFSIVWGEQAVETSLMSSGILLSLGLLVLLCGTNGRKVANPSIDVAVAGG